MCLFVVLLVDMMWDSRDVVLWYLSLCVYLVMQGCYRFGWVIRGLLVCGVLVSLLRFLFMFYL